MPRQATGQVLERTTSRGTVYALRFRAYGARQYVTLGRPEDGWSRVRADVELANVLADVRRGIWRPPTPDVEPEAPAAAPTFHRFATEWLEARRPELRPNTLLDYEWQLTHHLLPFFARHELRAITVAEVDRYRAAKLTEGTLSATSINKTITRLGQVLEVALEYGHVDGNAARIGGKRRKVKARTPQRSYLDRADHITALIDAAGELDAEARADRRDVPRRAIVATLALAGLRIGELQALRWREVDLAAGRLKVADAKTDAGVREVDLLPTLREELMDLKARTRRGRPEDYVFATATGSAPLATNLRRRVLAKAVERANERLEAADQAPLPEHLTPHSLRRTFASLLFALGHAAPIVMDQLGHTDPKLTLRIYARAMRRDAGEVDRLRALAGVSDWAPTGTGTASLILEAPRAR